MANLPVCRSLPNQVVKFEIVTSDSEYKFNLSDDLGRRDILIYVD